MKSKTKILIGAGIGLIGLSVYKANQIKKAIEQLEVKIADIKKLKLNWNDISVSTVVDLEIINPTTTNISLSTGGTAKVTRIAFFNKATHTLIGEGVTEIDKIIIAPNSSTKIKDIKVYVPIVTGLLANTSLLSNTDLLETQITIVAFGKEYILTS